jgi:hypothetical protein
LLSCSNGDFTFIFDVFALMEFGLYKVQ